jgi:hypothetical protein
MERELLELLERCSACPTCGYPQIGGEYCGGCGRSLEGVERDPYVTKRCGRCSHEQTHASRENLFCEQCGAAFD